MYLKLREMLIISIVGVTVGTSVALLAPKYTTHSFRFQLAPVAGPYEVAAKSELFSHIRRCRTFARTAVEALDQQGRHTLAKALDVDAVEPQLMEGFALALNAASIEPKASTWIRLGRMIGTTLDEPDFVGIQLTLPDDDVRPFLAPLKAAFKASLAELEADLDARHKANAGRTRALVVDQRAVAERRFALLEPAFRQDLEQLRSMRDTLPAAVANTLPIPEEPADLSYPEQLADAPTIAASLIAANADDNLIDKAGDLIAARFLFLVRYARLARDVSESRRLAQMLEITTPSRRPRLPVLGDGAEVNSLRTSHREILAGTICLLVVALAVLGRMLESAIRPTSRASLLRRLRQAGIYAIIGAACGAAVAAAAVRRETSRIVTALVAIDNTSDLQRFFHPQQARRQWMDTLLVSDNSWAFAASATSNLRAAMGEGSPLIAGLAQRANGDLATGIYRFLQMELKPKFEDLPRGTPSFQIQLPLHETARLVARLDERDDPVVAMEAFARSIGSLADIELRRVSAARATILNIKSARTATALALLGAGSSALPHLSAEILKIAIAEERAGSTKRYSSVNEAENKGWSGVLPDTSSIIGLPELIVTPNTANPLRPSLQRRDGMLRRHLATLRELELLVAMEVETNDALAQIEPAAVPIFADGARPYLVRERQPLAWLRPMTGAVMGALAALTVLALTRQGTT